MSGSKDDTPRGRRIAQLNDEFRRTQTGGRTVMTLGVQANIIAALRQFSDFDADNDPHYAFTREGLHPNTPLQILNARSIAVSLP